MTDINVISSTQKIYVDIQSSTISVINAGPQGPAGPPGVVTSTNDNDDELIALIESLDVIVDMSNGEINSNRVAVIKDLARACRTIARIAKGP